MNGHPESLSVLVVCDGNVCRSPTAQYALAVGVQNIRVESAGWRARPGSALCTVVAEAISAQDGEAAAFARTFRSRTLAEVSLDNYDLVLAATAQLRGELARDAPPLRDRFFTLREADSALSALRLAAPGRTGLDAPALVAAMNEYRWATGAVADALAKKRRKFVDPGDIPDGHGLKKRHHRAIVQLTLATARSIASSLVELPLK